MPLVSEFLSWIITNITNDLKLQSLLFLFFIFGWQIIIKKPFKKVLKSVYNIIIFIFIVATILIYYSYSTKSYYKNVIFKPLKNSYRLSEKVGFKLAVDKDAYYYIFSESTKRMIMPNRYEKSHFISANSINNIKDAFSIVDNKDAHKERVILILSNHKIDDFEKLLKIKGEKYPKIDDKIYKKYLLPSSSIKITKEYKDSKIARFETFVNIVKSVIQVNISSNRFKVNEDVSIDVTSSQDGCIALFELMPNGKVKRLQVAKVEKNEKFRGSTIAKEPFGEHIVVAIYKVSNCKDINTTDFKINKYSSKGGTMYNIDFVNKIYLDNDISSFIVER